MDRAALESFANSRKDVPEYRPEDEIKLTENRPEGLFTSLYGKNLQIIIEYEKIL